MTKDEIRHKKLPDKPGVYFFKGKNKKILYIGKATSLRNRVASYFASNIALVRSERIRMMVEEALDVTVEITDSVLEAVILEANSIKKHQPDFNVKEKDNKSFNYVVITEEVFPRLVIVRERELLMNQRTYKDLNIKYEFGPFPNGSVLKEALRIIRKIFPFRDAKANQTHSERFYRQLGLSPNIHEDTAQKEYARTIQHLRLFFEGKKNKLLKTLEGEMKQYAKAEKFEKAGERKKQLFALRHIRDVSLIKEEYNDTNKKNFRIEAYDIAHLGGKNVVGVMIALEDGEARKDQYRKFIIRRDPGINDTKALQEVLERRLEHPEWQYPRLIVIDGGKAQYNIASKVLEKSGIIIPLVSVTKNEHHRPEKIIGDKSYIALYEREILLVNSEAHRFAISFYRNKQRKNQFL